MSFKKIAVFICLCLAGIAFFLMSASLAGTLAGRPIFFSIVKSDSMYPMLSRGDIVFIRPIIPSENLSAGDIILFKSMRNSSINDLIVHQITAGNDIDGYITKGLANFWTDQDNDNLPLIKRDWIVSKVTAYNGSLIKIPLLGFPLLWLNDAKDCILILPLICFTIIIIILIDYFICKSKFVGLYSRNLLVFSGGFFLSLLIACYTVSSSQLWLIDYNSARNIPLENNLFEIQNKWPFPLLLACNTTNHNLKLIVPAHTIASKKSVYPHLVIAEQSNDKAASSLWIATFLPLCPANWVIYLTKISFSLALIVVSVIPGLPLMLFPLFSKLFSKSE